MATCTLVDGDRETSVEATVRDDTLLAPPDDVARATGWHLEPEGLCRGDVCVPVRDREALVVGGAIDIAAFAAALQRPVAIETAPPVAVLGGVADRAELPDSRTAPTFTLPDVDGRPVSLDDFAGRKRLLVAWASWCGCRWELPAWQELYKELAPHGLALISISLDEDPDAARYWAREDPPSPITYPVVVDRDHRVAEQYGMVNVPTTVWIDEDGRIARPPSIAPGDDRFKDFTKIDSSLHHEALRRWVLDDVAPMDDDEIDRRVDPPTNELQRARAERRLAMHLLRAGYRDAAETHLARALELAPTDWTIQRGSMPVRGMDPFGQDFFDFYQSWEAAGRPGYSS
jgi:peroxiredoxin